MFVKITKKHVAALLSNCMLPGAGYFFFGKRLVGLATGLVSLAVYATGFMHLIVPAWVIMNLAIFVDLLLPVHFHHDMMIDATRSECRGCAAPVGVNSARCEHCGTVAEAP